MGAAFRWGILGITWVSLPLWAGEARAEEPESSDCPPGFHCVPVPESEAHTPQGPVPAQPGGASAPIEEDGSTAPADEGPLEAESDFAPEPGWVRVPRVDAPRPPPPEPRGWSHFLIAPRLGVPLFDAGASRDAAMFAAGLGLRYAPRRTVAFELAVDGAYGTDYVGAARREGWLSGSFVFQARPRGLSPYVLVGPAISAARSELDGATRSFVYLGGHFGVGLAIELSRETDLCLDWLAFARARVGGDGAPEYVDLRSGRHTDSSGGGLLRLGMTFGL